MTAQKYGVWGFLAVAALLLIAGWTPPLKPQPAAEPGVISVNGEAEVRIVPDEVILHLGVETSNESLTKAKQQNDQIVKKVIELAKKYGVSQDHIQTDYISIEPRYDTYSQRQFMGYFVHNSIAITLRDLTQFEGLLSAVLESGANYVQRVEFRTTKLRQYRDEARTLALQAAREKATAMAGTLGQTLGEPRSIQEEANDWWSGYNSWWWSGSNAMTQNVIQEVSGSSVSYDSSLAPGQIAIKARVAVSFAMMSQP